MSDDGEHSSVGDISDISVGSDGEEEISMGRSPPSRGNLEKESMKLKSKFKMLRQALAEEKLAEVNKRIEEIENNAHPVVAEELHRLETRKSERIMVVHERKRVKVEAIVNEYRARVQGIRDEKKAIELELTKTMQAQSRKGTGKHAKRRNGSKPKRGAALGSDSGVGGDLETIKKVPESKADPATLENDSRALIHSE